MISVLEDVDQLAPARAFLERVTDLARLPEAKVTVRHGELEDQLTRIRAADLDIFGFAGDPGFEFGRRVLRTTGSSCLFVGDSDEENVLA